MYVAWEILNCRINILDIKPAYLENLSEVEITHVTCYNTWYDMWCGMSCL